MSKINRRYIDTHWLVYIMRGVLAGVFGLLMLFNSTFNIDTVILPVCVFLLAMGSVDAVNAIFNSHKHQSCWMTSIFDACVDIVAALVLLFAGRDSIVSSVVIISVYTIISGVIDILHSALSTKDPTDRFIRAVVGVFGCIAGLVILNAGNFEMMAFFRFFGAYLVIVGITSLIYGVHNRAQKMEDHLARQESAHHTDSDLAVEMPKNKADSTKSDKAKSSKSGSKLRHLKKAIKKAKK